MIVRHHQLSIVEAAETLSNIAELDFDQEVGIVQKHEFTLLGEQISYKTVSWLHLQNGKATFSLVCEIFRTITHYLQGFYKGEQSSFSNQNSVEGIKTLMILVEEAAKKLDKYAVLLSENKNEKNSVKEFKEYKQLQEVYFSKIARKKDEGNLSKWILSLSLKKDNKLDKKLLKNTAGFDKFSSEIEEGKRQFVDLETVKIDSEYELLQIRRQDSSRFFNPRLLRNVKLICDLALYFKIKKLNPLVSIDYWIDYIAYSSAKHLIKNLGSQLDLFLKELRAIKNNELVIALNSTVMALMFSALNKNLLDHQPVKSCAGYFQDFLRFLRSALQTELYKKWTLDPPKKSNNVAWDLLKFTHRICSLLYTNVYGWEEIAELTGNLVKQAEKMRSKDQTSNSSPIHIWEKILSHYEAFNLLIKQHPNGPLIKLIKGLENNCLNAFDPLYQQNIPQQLFDLHYQEKRISLIRMPTPTHQQLINQATVTGEFKAFIKDYGHFTPVKKHLIINLQNRTSWKEYARCLVLEELQLQTDYIQELCVVTLAINTDFYFQLTPYLEVEESVHFIAQFQEHLKEQQSGFYFPASIASKSLESFTTQAFAAILKVFFDSSSTLSRDQRLNFIEIFYLLLEVKLLEWTSAQTFSLMCKDGIDQGSAHATLLFIFLKLVNQQEYSEYDEKFTDLMLFMPALLLRERLVLAEPFNRMILVLKCLEERQEKLGADIFAELIHLEVGSLYDTDILKSTVLTPHLKSNTTHKDLI